MRNLLALVGAATITFVGMGWYLDWYKIARKPSPNPGVQRLEIDVNPQKIGNDVKQGIQRGGEMIERLQQDTRSAEEVGPQQPQDNGSPKPLSIPSERRPSESSQPTPSSSGGIWRSLDTLPARPTRPTFEEETRREFNVGPRNR